MHALFTARRWLPPVLPLLELQVGPLALLLVATGTSTCQQTLPSAHSS
jgi:hypothetical protein